MKRDIENLDDIKLLVNTFYGRIQKNLVLGPIFEEKVGGRWDQHLEKMYRFWQTILFNEHKKTIPEGIKQVNHLLELKQHL